MHGLEGMEKIIELIFKEYGPYTIIVLLLWILVTKILNILEKYEEKMEQLERNIDEKLRTLEKGLDAIKYVLQAVLPAWLGRRWDEDDR